MPALQRTDSRPSFLWVVLIDKSEMRELLDEVYLYALEQANEFALVE
jgi:hypothetical protein